MKQDITIASIFSKNDTKIFISKEAEETVRVLLDGIRSDRNTTIELDEFYEGFDSYRRLQWRRSILKNKLLAKEADPVASIEIKKEMDGLVVTEKKLRISILELALSLQNAADSQTLTELKHKFKNGLLVDMDAQLPGRALQKNQAELLQNEQSIKEVSQKLAQNASEFLIKAQLTNLNYELKDRLEKAVFYFDKGLVSVKASQDEKTRAGYYYTYGSFLFEYERFGEAESLYKQALEIYRNHRSVYTYEIPDLLTHMGVLYRSMPQIQSARKCYQVAMKIYRRLDHEGLGEVKADMAYTLNNLGILESDQRFFAASQRAFSEALRIFEDLVSTHSKSFLGDLALTLNNIGNLKAEQDDYEGALSVLKRSLAIRKRLAKNDPVGFIPAVGMTLNNMAVLQMEHQRLKGAEKSFNQSIQIYQALSEKDPERFLSAEAMGYYNLGNLQYDNHQFGKAEKAFRRASGLFEKRAGTSAAALLDLVLVKNSLGMALTDLHKHQEAEAVHLDGIAMVSKIEKSFPKTILADKAMLLTNLGDLYRKLGKDKALSCYLEAKDIWRKLTKFYPGSYKHLQATTLSNLGLLFYDRKQFGRASKSFEDSLKIRMEMVQVDKAAYLPGLAETLNNASILYLDTKQYKQAIQGFSRAFNIYTQLSKGNRRAYLPDLAMALYNLGIAHGRIKQYKEAWINYRRAHKIYCSLSNEQSDIYYPDIAMISLSMAELFQEEGRNKSGSLKMVKEGIRAIIAHMPVTRLSNDIEMAVRIIERWKSNPKDFIQDHFRDHFRPHHPYL